jgi:hypothetical protein
MVEREVNSGRHSS